jgi:trans-2,3-dihydro-3-hydroxyanthranilate isomerase
MADYEFVTVDVFTDQRFGGNPLAVFPDARGLSDAHMQALAREFNLSETTFVLPPADPANTARVRIFTPRRELPFAGHPNVGTAFVLARAAAERRETMTFEEAAGLVPVTILRGVDGQPIGAELEAPHSLSLGDGLPTELLADCVGLDPSDICTEAHHPLVASVGIGFIIAELASREALARAHPDTAAFSEAAGRFPELAAHFAVHLYARDPDDPARLATRMFAPPTGIMEDPATGSANAALAALLVSLAPGEDVTLAFDITQGVEMGRPSRLLAEASKTAEGAVLARIGGDCVPVMRGVVEL